ncbi:MAG: 2-amino-4-hydroxy-6-hydroxymethyldihydropteridine diphosphokinase [Syntrophomonadaceae bacterium]|nr:2-amino-4-hydroxy-6-hydroxymethyldihydropteridine diphosphokinase [Syntrophomonadaceae bacterium]
MRNRVYIGLGSNMGDKAANLARARQLINSIDDLHIIKVSSLYLTAPWGKTDQEDFVNQVIAIDTELTPLDLLHQLQDIEIKLGRQRNVHWGPRVIDLDVLLYGRETIAMEELKVPHPYLMQRLFVLIPLQEIEPELVFPDGSKIMEVLHRITDSAEASDIRKL